MKATFLILVLLVTASFCFGIIQFNLGADFAGNHHTKIKYMIDDPAYDDYTDEDDYEVAMGISPAIEYMLRHEGFLYGLGAEYQVQRDGTFKDEDGNPDKNKFGFIPIYGVVRYQFDSAVGINPELIGQAGYNFFTADDDYKFDGTLKGGLYWGIGAGLAIRKNYILQVIYKTNYGLHEGRAYDNDAGYFDYENRVTNSQINISFGYRM